MVTLFAPVRREAIREKVCAAIREAVLTGKLKTGQRLPEVQLAREFEVSRAVIREALQQLAHEGLVQQTVNRGAQVIDLSPEEVDEIIHLRTILEPEAVRLARSRMGDEDKRRLMELARETEQARADVELFVRCDLAFHEAIWALSGNATLRKHLRLLTAPVFSMGIILRHSQVLSGNTGGVPLAGLDHLKLAKMIVEGRVEDAIEAVREHITASWDRTSSAVAQLHRRGKLGRARSK